MRLSSLFGLALYVGIAASRSSLHTGKNIPERRGSPRAEAAPSAQDDAVQAKRAPAYLNANSKSNCSTTQQANHD